jgi:transcriptional regulator with XRE-family HTH domain
MDHDAVQAMEFRMAFGRHMHALRKRRGLSQARAGRLAGVHRTNVGDMERGKHAVGIEMLHRYAVAYELPIHALLPPSHAPARTGVDRVRLTALGVELLVKPRTDRILAFHDDAGLDQMLVPATADMVAVVEAMCGVDLGADPMRTP